MILPNWLCKKPRKTYNEIMDEIEEHRKQTKVAEKSLDKMIAVCRYLKF